MNNFSNIGPKNEGIREKKEIKPKANVHQRGLAYFVISSSKYLQRLLDWWLGRKGFGSLPPSSQIGSGCSTVRLQFGE